MENHLQRTGGALILFFNSAIFICTSGQPATKEHWNKDFPIAKDTKQMFLKTQDTMNIFPSPENSHSRKDSPATRSTCQTGMACQKGCCLHGRCSQTGGVFDPCYANIVHNGNRQSGGIWNNTDVCPCHHSLYCLVLFRTPADSHNEFGPKGFCLPRMG